MLNFAIAIGITGGLVQVIKQATKINTDYVPLLAVIVGIIISMVFGTEGWQMNLFVGIITGLSSAGLYDNLEGASKMLKK